MPDPTIWPIPSATPTGPILAPAVSGPVLAANSNRLDAEIINTSDPSEAISLSRGGVAILGAGLTLTARGSSYSIRTGNLFYGVINAISATGDATLSIDEGTKP